MNVAYSYECKRCGLKVDVTVADVKIQRELGQAQDGDTEPPREEYCADCSIYLVTGNPDYDVFTYRRAAWGCVLLLAVLAVGYWAC